MMIQQIDLLTFFSSRGFQASAQYYNDALRNLNFEFGGAREGTANPKAQSLRTLD
jgi:hypothetical protein